MDDDPSHTAPSPSLTGTGTVERYGYCREQPTPGTGTAGTTHTRYGYCREQPTPGTATVGLFSAPAGLTSPVISHEPEPELLQKELHEHPQRAGQPLRVSKRCSGAQ